MSFMARMMDDILFLVGGRINVSWDCCALVRIYVSTGGGVAVGD